jgi:allophanate hydrolase
MPTLPGKATLRFSKYKRLVPFSSVRITWTNSLLVSLEFALLMVSPKILSTRITFLGAQGKMVSYFFCVLTLRSSGGGVVVSGGQVTFALVTDTAGSGRVPAAFNNIVGLKPTKGLISTRGVVPACRSLDCLSIFALTCDDAWSVLDAAAGFDFEDEYSRPKPSTLPSLPSKLRIGVPKQLEFYGAEMAAAERLYRDALVVIEKEMGAELVEIDFRPFTSVARILYDGPWVSERLAALKDFYASNAEHVFPVTRGILEKGKSYSAVDTFLAMRHLERMRKKAFRVWRDADLTALVVPTASVTPTIAAVQQVPIGYNTVLGYYTNFVNLLDLCGIAVPNGFLPAGVPSGVTFISTAFQDELTFSLGRAFHHARGLTMGATSFPLPPVSAKHTVAVTTPVVKTGETVQLSVVGAHMSGLELNHQLVEIGGKLAKTCRTAPVYRFYDITKEGDKVRRPGLVRVKDGAAKDKKEVGAAIETEVWSIPVEKLGHFVKNLKAPLTIGLVELEDGSRVLGFICEGFAAVNAKDISELGGWRNYVKE